MRLEHRTIDTRTNFSLVELDSAAPDRQRLGNYQTLPETLLTWEEDGRSLGVLEHRSGPIKTTTSPGRRKKGLRLTTEALTTTNDSLVAGVTPSDIRVDS